MRAAWYCVLLACAPCLSMAQAVGCGSLENGYGPYDYRTEQNGKLRIVERFHFTPKVEALIAGESTAFVGGDLSYTLRTSPNHHRALMAVVRLGEKTKSPQPPYLEYSIDCYFDRAIRFQPDDTVVRELYARYLEKTNRREEAVRQLDVAIKTGKDSGISQYNIGLIFFEMKEYERALVQAFEARRLGFDGAGLVNRLKAVGKWREPPNAPHASGSAVQKAQ